MIKNTNAECKLVGIHVRKTTAYITLLIHSTEPADIDRVFRFYLKDGNTTALLSTNNYWIDRTNSYVSDATNINIEMHKEIILEVDITKNFTAPLKQNRWVRECALVMVDVTANATWAWQSSPLTLISATIPLPEIKNIEAYSNTGYTKLNIGFTYDLKNTEDIEFMKHNLITTISLYSAEDLLLIEELMVTNEMITGNEVEAFFLGEYRNFMLIKIRMATHAGTILKTVDKTYSPYEQSKVLYTVVNGEVKKIGTVYQKGVAYFPDQIIDIKTSVVLPPIITKDTEIPYLFHIERQDTEGALPNHYVDVYINDTLFLTTQEEDLDLTQYLQQYEHSVMITMKFISKRTLSGYTWYCDTPVILQGFNLVVGPDLICDFTTII